MPYQLCTRVLSALAVIGTLTLGSATASAQGMEMPIVIDAATGQQIQIQGLSPESIGQLSQGQEVFANTAGGRIMLRGEVYRPGIWTDPDGCQHWVMDDGIEGYMAPILTRHGMPVCNTAPMDVGNRMIIRKYDVPYTGKLK